MKKKVFDSIVLDMMCTEKFMPTENDVVRDEDILLRLAEIDDVEQKDRDGRTLLINASMYGRKEIVEYLLGKGADIQARDKEDFTALHAAVMSDNVQLVEILLNNGADVNATNIYGNTPLWVCKNRDNHEMIRLLISSGADPNKKNNYGISVKDKWICYDDIMDILKSSSNFS